MTDPTPQTTPTRDEAVRGQLPIWLEGGIASRLSAAMHAYLKDYVYSPDEGADHEPTDFERWIMEDMLNGALSDQAVNAILQDAAFAMLASAPAPASGGVDAIAAIIAKWVDEKRFADAPAFRMAAREIIASLSPAATPVSEAGRKETHQLDSGLSCEFDGDCYMLTWPDGHWLTAKTDGSIIVGRWPSSEWHQPARKTSVAALAKPASSPAGGDVRDALEPFAQVAERYDSEDHLRRQLPLSHFTESLTIEHFRKALAALSQSTSAGRVGE